MTLTLPFWLVLAYLGYGVLLGALAFRLRPPRCRWRDIAVVVCLLVVAWPVVIVANLMDL